MLSTGDVRAGPSYGAPIDGTYASVPDWEQKAIAGFAVIYEQVGKELLPLPLGANVVHACEHKTCYFQADRY
jgi:hypothetical protein